MIGIRFCIVMSLVLLVGASVPSFVHSSTTATTTISAPTTTNAVSTVNLKKYMYARDFVERDTIQGALFFDVPSDILEKIYSLDDVRLMKTSTKERIPLTIVEQQAHTSQKKHILTPREVYRGNGKHISMVPAGNFNEDSILHIGLENIPSGGGTISLFFTGINLGIDWSYWQVIAKDIPISVNTPYRTIIRSLTDVRIGSLIEASSIRRTDFDYDPQIMVVYKPAESRDVHSLPTHVQLSVTSPQQESVIPLYGYIEETDGTSSTFIIDMRQELTSHFGVSLTVRESTYASYVKVSTSKDKNDWTLRTTDTIWADPTLPKHLVSEDMHISYPKNNDRYVRIEFMSPVQIHPLVRVSYTPIALKASVDQPTDLRDLQLLYGVPTLYQEAAHKADSSSSTIAPVSALEGREVILGPEIKNAAFFPLDTSELIHDSTLSSLAYGAFTLYGETGIVLILVSLVLLSLWLVVFRKRT